MNEINSNQYWTNQHGNLIHVDNIDEIDKLRDRTVREIHDEFNQMNARLKVLKEHIFDDIASFVSLSLEQYGVKHGGNKGNIQLHSFDGQYRVVYAISDRLSFDERIHAAKILIDECLREWTEGSRSEVKTLIDSAFNVDKEGNLNTTRILSLRRLDITDQRWKSAMDAISDSIKINVSKAYVRVYERQKDGKYKQLSLDFAGV